MNNYAEIVLLDKISDVTRTKDKLIALKAYSKQEFIKIDSILLNLKNSLNKLRKYRNDIFNFDLAKRLHDETIHLKYHEKLSVFAKNEVSKQQANELIRKYIYIKNKHA